jgi:hypothetical protein
MVWGEDEYFGRFERHRREQGGDFFGGNEMVGSDEDTRGGRNIPMLANVPSGFEKAGCRYTNESGRGESQNVLRRKRRALCTPDRT